MCCREGLLSAFGPSQGDHRVLPIHFIGRSFLAMLTGQRIKDRIPVDCCPCLLPYDHLSDWPSAYNWFGVKKIKHLVEQMRVTISLSRPLKRHFSF